MAVVVLEVAVESFDSVAGFGDPNENIPVDGVVVVAAGLLSAGFAPKLNDGLLDAANVPKPTVAGLVGSAVLEAGLPKVIGEASFAGLDAAAAATGDPKLNPPLLGVAVVSFLGSACDSLAGFVPNEKPPDPKPVVGFDSSFFSLVLLLSVVSAAGFAPKLNPDDAPVVAVVLLLLPNENLGLSSELEVAVAAAAAGLLPNVNPPELGGGAELDAGTPNENPDFGASLLAESAFFGTPKLNPEPAVVEAAAGLLPNENEGASAGVDPGLACSQQAHLLRVASLRVMQALHSHLPADCCATKLLKPWSVVVGGGGFVEVGIENIDLMAAGTAEATEAAAVGAAPGLGLLQQAQLVLSASLRVIQSEHSHRADC